MAAGTPTPPPPPSFSPYRKWGIGLNVALVLLAVLAVVTMVNYLSQDYFLRFHWGERTRHPLSPLTVKYLQSLTNQVKVTLYYDKDNAYYTTILDLLNEYKLGSSKISLRLVDYKRDPAAAQQLQTKDKYEFLANQWATNVVIFDAGKPGEGQVKYIQGDALAQVTIEPTGDKEAPYRRKMLAFAGERAFTAMLIQVTNPKRAMAYVLQGHGEHPIDNANDPGGYLKFCGILAMNNIEPKPLQVLGTNSIPADCDLLVVPGPRTRIPDVELQKIDQYLTEGGRLLALFSFASVNQETGLEKILAKWGVAVGTNIVIDPDHCLSGTDELIVSAFSMHPVVNPLLNYGIELIKPRPVGELKGRPQSAEAPQVKELMASGQNSLLEGVLGTNRAFPLAVAVEKGAIKGVITERGTTRMVVIGDSFCLANAFVDSDSFRNHDFAGYLANWLLDRPQLLEGIGPRVVKEYKLQMTRTQLQSAEWILLGAMPGASLVLGWLVWFRRRR
jgi:hypothetical protein